MYLDTFGTSLIDEWRQMVRSHRQRVQLNRKITVTQLQLDKIDINI